MPEVREILSGAFFLVFLTVQAVYPSLKWFNPERNNFSWSMYSGVDQRPTVTVVLEDGSSREIPNPASVTSPVRVFSASVNLWRTLPRYACARVNGAREVRAVHEPSGRNEVTLCPSAVD
jgi:hypothetical protein